MGVRVRFAWPWSPASDCEAPPILPRTHPFQRRSGTRRAGRLRPPRLRCMAAAGPPAADVPLHRALGLTDDEAVVDRRHPRAGAEPPRAGDVLGDVVRALLLQVLPDPPAPAARPRRPHVLVGPGRGRRAWSTSATASPRPSGSRATTTRPPSSPTRAPPPASAGILRDVFSMGARPIALMDPLRFGPLDDPRSRWIAEGVVSGVSGYGNSVGVPTVGGETVFDPTYQDNPLVNVFCLGTLPAGAARAGSRLRPGEPHRAVRVGDRARRHRRRERPRIGRLR